MNIEALVCGLQRERDNYFVWRWVLPYSDPCQCSSVILGEITRNPPTRVFEPLYTTCLMFSYDVTAIRKHYEIECDVGSELLTIFI